MFNPVALELQRLMQDESTPSAQIERAIARDPALATQVLRLANSSAYSGLVEISTIRQALMRLGAKSVMRLAMASAQISLYRSKLALYQRRMDALWRAAYGSATAAAWLAETSGHAALADQAFLAGLLHDIGKLLILATLEKLGAEPEGAQDLSGPLVEEMLDQLHCEYGHRLMQAWNLPEPYRVVVRDHHAESCSPGNVLLLVVRLADQVCEKIGVDSAAQSGRLPAASEEARVLGIGEVRLAELEVVLEDLLEMEPAA